MRYIFFGDLDNYDYISTICGYDWREPTINEIKEVNDLIISIMPIKDNRDLFLQIMCTALDGKCLEKFVIFNGGGGNGKGVIDDLLLHLCTLEIMNII
jgi:phage/plasmid-associated DNA primase